MCFAKASIAQNPYILRKAYDPLVMPKKGKANNTQLNFCHLLNHNIQPTLLYKMENFILLTFFLAF